MSFKDTISKQIALNRIIDLCIHYLTLVKNQPYTSADERDKAVAEVQKAMPMIRRYLVYFRTQELETKNNQGPEKR